MKYIKKMIKKYDQRQQAFNGLIKSVKNPEAYKRPGSRRKDKG